MTLLGLVPALEREERLDPLADTVRSAVQRAYAATGPAGRLVANALYGVWLKHPLHPVLSDIPIGAWTAALALDLLAMREEGRQAHPSGPAGRIGQMLPSLALRRHPCRDLARGADVVIAVGLAGALGAAASGLTDWQHERGGPARLGLTHGLLNAGATALYAGSLLLRATRRRATARACAFAGFGLLLAGGYLGGDLVFRQALGVDRTHDQEPAASFTPVLEDAALADGAMRRVELRGTPVLLARWNGKVHALLETCTHRGGPLSEGELRDGCVSCPWHGSRFRLADGAVVDGPATFPQRRLETRVREGRIEVRPA